ncbi:KN motif and ankyrin repeat domain-containing protein 4 isoform X2 [Crotalus tigris]|uniref:KN motif and ankyrin repeat domain-containing protein 4 isoform X2 n=1 Tax=Crotalus tigris TaxID=88082 RepID=UPI00192FA951|nr:KN motif and ankyrin repeat domain-containing protein 4 isoform X2 [Crotalus tigris]XP_039194991.1 KN motif and ankyrin repeat domain-containing protein 4 isoform X2 [Crotalus tigris]XP_039194993.1 KN motif and ankyrin repeat domain-containing protein 4 isoform X2 [Crotalus tigris]
MENTDDNWTSKAEDKNPPQSPYSVETPYGFHLDLDFLKYVDDIEKGNTIKRIPVRRKTKHPKFSTLPRNFSLPENGSNVYSSSLNKSFVTQRKTSLDAEENRSLVTPIDMSSCSPLPQEPSYRKKALLIETVKQVHLPLEEDTSNCKGRPQLLRASSMPAKLPPIPNLEEETHQAAFLPSGFLQSSNGNGLELDFSPAKKPSELNSSKRSSLPLHENLIDLKEQINKDIQDSDKCPGLRREVQQQTELHKEITQLSDPQQSQPLISQKSPEVVESGEKCHATQVNVCPSSIQSRLVPTGTSENMSIKQSQEEVELNICETVTEEVEEEDEVTSLSTKEVEKNIELEPFLLTTHSNIRALQQHIAILEKQLNNKTEELEQIRVVLKQQDQEMKAKERSIELLASSKAQLEEKLCGENIKEIKPGVQARKPPQYFDVAVNTEHVHEKITHEIAESITEPVELLGGDTYEADDKNVEIRKELLCTEISNVSADDGGRDKPIFQSNKEGERIGQDSDCSIVEPSYNVLHVDNENNKTERNPLTAQLLVPGEENCSGPKTADIKSKGMQIIFQEDAQRDQEEQNYQQAKESPADPIVGQYIKKIQDLLQEQWLCLEHGYPELASAIKHPASKLSSIQNQLVNSLNLLLSAYSAQTPTDQENSNTQYQQLEISPSTSLKSIMKKKEAGFHEGSNGTKKNLQFVGVNGGYETTSSEDSSCEENSFEGDSDNEMNRKHGNEEQSWGEEDEQSTSATPQSAKKDCDPEKLEETTQSTMQDKAERFRPSGDFLKGCQILSKNMSEIRTTKEKFLRHVLSTVCQEWFRISSRKSSSPEIVAAYLQEIEAVHPHLQSVIVNLADGNGNTALHYSVSHSNFWIVKLLLETGVCDVDYQNKAGYTAVMITPLASAETEEEMEVVKKLLQEGNVNIRASQGGQTALILGVSHDREDMVKALLSCNAEINLQDEDGLSPLMVASQHGNLEMVKLLLSHSGCDPTLVDKAGNSALSLALKSAHMEIVEFLRIHIHHTQSLNT